MPAPLISFYTGSGSPPSFAGCTATSSLGVMAAVYDYGTIDTGSTGSTTFFWIINNATGSLSGIAHAILSSSGQTYNGIDQLGLGEHASGSADHATTGVNAWDMQSGSLTGSVYISSSFYWQSAAGITGAAGASGSLSRVYMNPFSGSGGTVSRRLAPSALVLSGSPDGGGSGSGWLIASYISVLNGTPQGSRTGSFCLRYKYV